MPAIEVASFVDSRRVPQMAGAEEVVGALDRRDDVAYAGLALNERGYERLAAAGLDEVRFAFGVTESFNQRNQGTPVEGSLRVAGEIVSRAREASLRSRDAQRRVRLSVRGTGEPVLGAGRRRARRSDAAGRAGPRRHDRSRGARRQV
ncbi:MAG TPA: hypothetical protein VFR38_04995 [Gaiellaceae bacterium]|nr:hypothetical protein [Gaiellaceae bacterium]